MANNDDNIKVFGIIFHDDDSNESIDKERSSPFKKCSCADAFDTEYVADLLNKICSDIPENDPHGLKGFKSINPNGDEQVMSERLYTAVTGMMPCSCMAEVAITRPGEVTHFSGGDTYTTVSFTAICPKCLKISNFNWSKEFFEDFMS